MTKEKKKEKEKEEENEKEHGKGKNREKSLCIKKEDLWSVVLKSRERQFELFVQKEIPKRTTKYTI